MANDDDSNSEPVPIQWDGNNRVQDNVVRYHWEPGDINEVSEDEAAQLLTNGGFSEVVKENDDGGCSESDRHMVFSRDNEPCPECGEDKWVAEETTTDDYDDGTGLDFSEDDTDDDDGDE